jgi:hypothetical protein
MSACVDTDTTLAIHDRATDKVALHFRQPRVEPIMHAAMNLELA